MALRISPVGNMGEAMIRGLLSAKLRSPEQVVVYDAARVEGRSFGAASGVAAPVPSRNCCAPATRWWSP